MGLYPLFLHFEAFPIAIPLELARVLASWLPRPALGFNCRQLPRHHGRHARLFPILRYGSSSVKLFDDSQCVDRETVVFVHTVRHVKSLSMVEGLIACVNACVCMCGRYLRVCVCV
jgi:hypothetical protein